MGRTFSTHGVEVGPPLLSSGQSFWLQIQRSWVRFPELPDFLSPLSLVRTTEELLGRNSSVSGQENRY
jgi:hypothetical protein